MSTDPVIFDARVVTGAGGGPEKTILSSPRFLRPLGYRMRCGYLHPPGDPGFETIRRRAAELDAPLVAIPDRGPLDTQAVRQLVAVCRRERVRVWHGHDPKTNALGLLVSRFHPMRLVTTVHGYVLDTRRSRLYRRLDRLLLPWYERVIGVSADLCQFARRCGVPPRKVLFLENGIDASAYARRRSTREARAAVGLPPAGVLVGAIGRLSPEKGFDVLIRAAHSLGGDVRLVIVGDGPERPSLERLIADLGLGDRVTLAGWRTDVRAYFEALDVFALSSRREGLPNVLLEAMAVGVPVVATSVNGVPAVVTDGVNGRLVPADDVSALAAALRDVMSNPAAAAGFVADGRRTVEGRYSFAARMKKLATLYDELLSGRSAAASGVFRC